MESSEESDSDDNIVFHCFSKLSSEVQDNLLKMDSLLREATDSNLSIERVDLIKKLDISEATFYRYLKYINEIAGKQILKCENGRYSYNEKDFFLTNARNFSNPRLILSERKKIALQMTKSLLNVLDDSEVYDQLKGVYEFLCKNIQGAEKLEGFSDRILFLGMDEVKVKDDVFENIEKAMIQNKYIRFNYFVNGKDISVTIKPYQLIYYRGMWTLYGERTNQEYKGLKFFNLDRISDIVFRDATFKLPDDFSYVNKAKGSFGRFIGDEYTFKIKILSKSTLEYIKNFEWAEDQKFEELEDGSTVMRFSSNQYYPVLSWVLEKGMNVKPLEPPRLVEDWKKNVIAMAKMAEE